MLVHWDDVARERFEWEPETAATWQDLGRAAGTVGVGLRRMEVDPGKQSVPAHRHMAEEEIVFVLGGGGASWQDGRTCPIRAGDCIVHVADREAHTLVGGDDGLDVLVFGTRVATEFSYLPRTGRAHADGLWVEVAGFGSRPAERIDETASAGERPPNIVHLDDAEAQEWEEGDGGGFVRALGASAGSRRTGLNHETVPPGKLNTVPHCHSAEEEIFVVLDGEGTLLLGDGEHAVRRGHVVARPPGTGVAHAFRAGEQGLTLLSYGTREPTDIAYYPRSGVVALRGVGVLGRLEPVAPGDVR